MNNQKLLNRKVGILVANGFNEEEMFFIKTELQEMGACPRIISSEKGVVRSRNDTGWGHHFAVDCSLESALGADYDMLIIPGGSRSVDKLKLTTHARRFITGFMQAKKPVAVWGDALGLMIYTGQVTERAVSGPEKYADIAVQAGAVWKGTGVNTDSNLVTGLTVRNRSANFATRIVGFFMNNVKNTEVPGGSDAVAVA